MRINRYFKWLIYAWTALVFGLFFVVLLLAVFGFSAKLGLGWGLASGLFGFLLFTSTVVGFWLGPTVVLLVIGLLLGSSSVPYAGAEVKSVAGEESNPHDGRYFLSLLGGTMMALIGVGGFLLTMEYDKILAFGFLIGGLLMYFVISTLS